MTEPNSPNPVNKPNRKANILTALNPTIDLFQVQIHFDVQHPIYQALTKKERTRTEQKLTLVKQAAIRLAVAMLKGTVKYPTDNHTIREWLEYALDDAGDAFQYLHLIRDCLEVAEGDGDWMDTPIHITLDREEE